MVHYIIQCIIQCRVIDDIPYLPSHVILHTGENLVENRSENELLDEFQENPTAAATATVVKEPVCKSIVGEENSAGGEVNEVTSSQTNAAANNVGEPAKESSQPEKMATEEPKTRVQKPRETIPEESAKEMIDAWHRHLLW